jgi:hypothetical protein
MITAQLDYGLVQRGHEYPIISEGTDWYRIRIKGKTVYVFKWVFEHD